MSWSFLQSRCRSATCFSKLPSSSLSLSCLLASLSYNCWMSLRYSDCCIYDRRCSILVELSCYCKSLVPSLVSLVQPASLLLSCLRTSATVCSFCIWIMLPPSMSLNFVSSQWASNANSFFWRSFNFGLMVKSLWLACFSVSESTVILAYCSLTVFSNVLQSFRAVRDSFSSPEFVLVRCMSFSSSILTSCYILSVLVLNSFA